MRYHVFIDGCRDVTPEGVERLAAALGQRYGMSPPAVKRRLKEGRFCARASLDRASAERLVGELEALGAHSSMVGEGRPGPGGETQATATPSGGARYESGLAAAFAGDQLRDDVPLDLGALAAAARQDGDPGAGWQLADVDGSGRDEGRRAARPPHGLSVTMPLPVMTLKPTATPTPARPASPPPVPAARPHTRSSDPFLPPDADAETLPELDVPTAVFPPEAQSALLASIVGELPRPVAPVPPAGSASSLPRWSLLRRVRDTMAGSARARFVAGVALAFLIGLVPAEIYAWAHAGSAYDDIRADLQADYDAADTPQRWAALATAREGAALRARSRQERLAVSSCLLWLLVGGGAAFVWFRFVDREQPASYLPAARSAAARRRSIK